VLAQLHQSLAVEVEVAVVQPIHFLWMVVLLLAFVLVQVPHISHCVFQVLEKYL
jgi:hypothetical protein